MDNKIFHFKELSFTVVATPHSHYVEYKIYDHAGYNEDGSPLFQKGGSQCSPDPVETIEESEVYLSGSVKWDGCSNWRFDEQDRVMLHGCCRDDILRYGLIMAACYDLTKELVKDNSWL